MGKEQGKAFWLEGLRFEDGEDGRAQSDQKALSFYLRAGAEGFANGFVSAGNLLRSLNELDKAAACYHEAGRVNRWLAPVMALRIAMLTEASVEKFITV